MVSLRAHRNESLRGLQWQHKTQDKNRLHSRNRSIFSGRKQELYQQIDHRSLNFLSTHRSIRLQFARLHGSANGYASMGTDLLFAIISTTEHRITRAIWNAITLELRASFLARKSSLSFFFNGCLVSHGLYQAIISTVQQCPPTNN